MGQPSLKAPPGLRETRLSESWQLSDSDLAYARQLGMQEAMIEREAVKFKNYCLRVPGPKGVKVIGRAPRKIGASDQSSLSRIIRRRTAMLRRQWSRPCNEGRMHDQIAKLPMRGSGLLP